MSWWRLMRGGNALLAAAAAWVGYYLASGQWWGAQIAVAILPPALITAAGNIDNDVCDIVLDAQIKPSRPIPLGQMSSFAALLVAATLALTGLAIAFSGGKTTLALAVAVSILLALYNRYFSGWLILGNVTIAILSALPILYGGLAAPVGQGTNLLQPFVASVIAFWVHLPREMLKDASDVEGDRSVGRLTLPVIVGPLKTTRWAGLVMFVAAAYVAWSAFCGCFGTLYTVGVLATIIPALLLGAAQCGFNPSALMIARWSLGLKLCMVAGLVWLVLGRV